ncbi:hypothetical protein Y032_0104g3601 [Ancylostoma ceylanicum]|uniref:Uncharacterized protein n=2 Tax=Ancylostoma ceylanicum TaxID=53326 RepID=A0A016TFN6_9BILA|nr:hypothetical protein Y032_0104g3601 [Ancylostoma ceylanicum]
MPLCCQAPRNVYRGEKEIRHLLVQITDSVMCALVLASFLWAYSLQASKNRACEAYLIWSDIADMLSAISMDGVGSFPAKLPPGRTYGSAPYQHTMVKHPSIDGLKGATLRVIVPSIEPPYKSTKLHAHLFNTTVLPALTYASETWALHKQDENAVSVIERSIERVMLGVTRLTQVNYANFSEQAEIEHGYGPGLVMELLKEMASLLDLKYEVSHVQGTLI